MFLDNDIKLDFSDVLILPKRSKLESRADVSLERTIKFPYSKHEFNGIPIIASNMVGVGTFKMHQVLAEYGILTAICKHYSVSHWVRNTIDPNYVIMSIGITNDDIKKAKEIINFFKLKYVMIDVANGYSEKFVDYIKKFRDMFPEICIMAGNVVTKEMTEALVLSGVDVVKTGIGSGCFHGNTKLLTSEGYKTFKELSTHKDFLIYNKDGELSSGKVWSTGIKSCVEIVFENFNSIICTPDHLFKLIDGTDCRADKLEQNVVRTHINKYGYKALSVKYCGDYEVFDFEEPTTHYGIVEDMIVHNSVCKTRSQTGVGFPQLSSVIETSNYAHALNANVISDGGCTCIGDISKAFCAGADFVQLGTMLAGHFEGDQEIITKYKKKEYLDSEDDSVFESHQFVEFFGSSSKKAQENYFGGFNDYRASEGREVLIPYKGNVTYTIKEILGGIRSTCTYVGAKHLKNLPKCATFIRVNNQLSKVMEKYEQ